MRVDKFIWAVRLYKTRSLASKMCSTENVKVNGNFVKASKEVKQGDVVSIKVNPIWREYKILDFPKSRVGAKLVVNLITEITDPNDIKTLEDIQSINRYNKLLGIKGRPTKKDRRALGKFNTKYTDEE